MTAIQFLGGSQHERFTHVPDVENRIPQPPGSQMGVRTGSKPKKTAAEYREELEEARQKARRLKHLIKFLKSELSQAQDELSMLFTSFLGRGGTIPKLEYLLSAAELWEADESATVVVWEKPPASNDGEKIISRVSEKRIYVRNRGSGSELVYYRDGTPVVNHDGYGKIDVTATLGEQK